MQIVQPILKAGCHNKTILADVNLSDCLNPRRSMLIVFQVSQPTSLECFATWRKRYYLASVLLDFIDIDLNKCQTSERNVKFASSVELLHEYSRLRLAARACV